jgi:hypothetical protein
MRPGTGTRARARAHANSSSSLTGNRSRQSGMGVTMRRDSDARAFGRARARRIPTGRGGRGPVGATAKPTRISDFDRISAKTGPTKLGGLRRVQHDAQAAGMERREGGGSEGRGGGKQEGSGSADSEAAAALPAMIPPPHSESLVPVPSPPRRVFWLTRIHEFNPLSFLRPALRQRATVDRRALGGNRKGMWTDCGRKGRFPACESRSLFIPFPRHHQSMKARDPPHPCAEGNPLSGAGAGKGVSVKRL